MKISWKAFLAVWIVSFFFALPAYANVKQTKAYKEAYPDEKPKCIGCHVSEKPKKEDGQHDLNDYGKKAVAAAAEPDAESYKKIGKIHA